LTKTIISFTLFFIFLIVNIQAQKKLDYTNYHQSVIEAEELISSKNYKESLEIYEQLFSDYEFVFLREYKIATQLAFLIEENQKGLLFLEKAIESGWQRKSIKKNKFILKKVDKNEWKTIKKKYSKLNKIYKSKIDIPLRRQVKKMLSKDQRKAFNAFLLGFSNNFQTRYTKNKFATHSKKQMEKTIKILETSGYPGERLIGNNFWMSTIISHHNSISQEHSKQDTFYPIIRPKLLAALKEGQVSPYEIMIIDDWYHTTLNESIYGIINAPSKFELININLMRKKIFVRSINVRNKLVDVEQETGINLYLDIGPWVNGKILSEN